MNRPSIFPHNHRQKRRKHLNPKNISIILPSQEYYSSITDPNDSDDLLTPGTPVVGHIGLSVVDAPSTSIFSSRSSTTENSIGTMSNLTPIQEVSINNQES